MAAQPLWSRAAGRVPCCVPVLWLGHILVTSTLGGAGWQRSRGCACTHVLQHHPASPAPEGPPGDRPGSGVLFAQPQS